MTAAPPVPAGLPGRLARAWLGMDDAERVDALDAALGDAGAFAQRLAEVRRDVVAAVVADAGSYTAAARRLGMSAAAVRKATLRTGQRSPLGRGRPRKAS